MPCISKGNGISSDVRHKLLCGCEDEILLCNLVRWIKYIKKDLAQEFLSKQKPNLDKYWACTKKDCANRFKLYEFSLYF